MIRVDDLVKEFSFYARPRDRLIEMLTGMRRGVPFRALDGVSLEAPSGGALAIVGANGAGKSTLLRILAGTLYPTSGRIVMQGRVASLLELGTGFHPDFSGRDNAVLNARLLGLGDGEIAERMPEIIEFAELGDFVDRPLRTYSAGMKVRLGFAVAASVSPEVLLIDEALSVGDAYFRQKCVRRIREFRERGVTVLFVSHDFTAVRTLCDRALLLDHGRVVSAGRPDEVLERYNSMIAARTTGQALLRLEAERSPGGTGQRSGTFEALITSVDLHDEEGRPVRAVTPGQPVEIRVRLHFLAPLERPTIGILIRDRLGNDVYGTNTFLQEVETGEYGAGESAAISFFLAADLGPGEYTLTAAVHSADTHLFDCYDWADRLIVFQVIAPATGAAIGTAWLRPRIAVGERQMNGVPPAPLLEELFGPAESRLDLRGRGCVFGWHEPEGAGEATFRWTAGRFGFLVDLDGERLCVEAGTERPQGAAVEARVHVGAKEVGGFSVVPGVPFTTFTVPLAPQTPPGLVAVSLSDTWRPKDTGAGADDRPLGLRVRRIWVE